MLRKCSARFVDLKCEFWRESRKGVRQECPTRALPTKVSYKIVKKCLADCFRLRVCIRVREFHLAF